MTDVFAIVGIGAAAAATVGLVGLALLHLLRRRSAYAALVGVAAISLLAVLTGVVAAARAMFLSVHDFQVVLLVAAPAGLVALGVSMLLGRRIVLGSRSLHTALRAIGAGEQPSFSDAPVSSELAALRKELETTSARLQESRERERALDASRRELISWVSHDLRTPLAGMRAMAESLEDGVAPDVARYHHQIRVEVDRLTSLVDDLFQLSRIHSGTLGLHLQRVALGELVSDTLAGTQALAHAAGVRLRGSATDPVPVRVDSRELSRALSNLIVNAIRHTPADGSVEVVAGCSEGVATLTVQDTCGGIPHDDLSRVFDVAWSGNGARTPGTSGGAGLGLSIVRGIVEAHCGSVSVANANGGCRFEVRLPRMGELTMRERAGA